MTRPALPSRRELTGVPFVPPPLATRMMNVGRWGLARLRRTSVPPAVVVLESVTAVAENRVLAILVQLDVPDLLAEGPATGADLAKRAGVKVEALDRVLRFAAVRGFVRQRPTGRYHATRLTEALRRDRAQPWRAWVQFGGSAEVLGAWERLPAALTGEDPFEAANGEDFFTFVQHTRPELGALFDDAMTAGALMQASLLDAALDWSGVSRVCDVGGGTGAAAELLLREHPQLRVALLELPEVIARARPALVDGPLADRVDLVAGDMFSSVPGGYDRYLLLAVLHDWSDDDAGRILEGIREALPRRGRIVVVDAVLRGGPDDEWATTTDLLMMTLTPGGRERNGPEWEALFRRAGLEVHARHTLASGYAAFEVEAGSPPR